MLKAIKFTLYILILPFCFSQMVNANTILVLGDSISAGYGFNPEQGWVNLLDKKLKANGKTFKVINGSVSGNTSGDGLARLPALLDEFKPNIVIIELGGNDGLRGHPIKLINRNLEKLIKLSQEQRADVLLAGIEIPPNYGQRYTDAFRQNYINIAKKYDLAFVPFILKDVATDPALMQNDGIHPKIEAQNILLNNVWPALETLLSKYKY